MLLFARAQALNSPLPEVSRVSQLNMAPDEPAGSFFHQVPDDADKNDDDKAPADVDDAFSELLRQRNKPLKASTPSTIDGVPTAKATGFGKPKKTAGKKPSKPFVGIGPSGVVEPPKRANDPTKPEFDDQGYTLYTDQETGEKSRVFEALVDYPTVFTMKIVGANEGSFVSEIVAIVAEACETQPDNVPHTTRSVGKWTSVTVKAPVQSSEMLYSLYEKVDLDPRVKFKF
jgi:putative lipoic acid-binding regulatory protein